LICPRTGNAEKKINVQIHKRLDLPNLEDNLQLVPLPHDGELHGPSPRICYGSVYIANSPENITKMNKKKSMLTNKTT
jgi:hypothetical protein